MTKSALILNFFSKQKLAIFWNCVDCEPSFSKPTEYWTVCCPQLGLVAEGGVGYVNLRKHAIVVVSLLFVTTDSPNPRRVASYNMRGNYYGELTTGHHRLIKHLRCGKKLWKGTCSAGLTLFPSSVIVLSDSRSFVIQRGPSVCGGEREKRRKSEKGRYDTVKKWYILGYQIKLVLLPQRRSCQRLL